MRALPVGHAPGDRDRGVKMRVAADALVEDDQVERAGQEAAEQDQRVRAIHQGGRHGDRGHLEAGAIQVPLGTSGFRVRPVSRAGGGPAYRGPGRPGAGGLTIHRWKTSSAVWEVAVPFLPEQEGAVLPECAAVWVRKA